MADDTKLLNSKYFSKFISEQLEKNMMEAAEPLIKSALADIEAKMRRELAISVSALCYSEVFIDKFQEGYTIKVKIDHKDMLK